MFAAGTISTMCLLSFEAQRAPDSPRSNNLGQLHDALLMDSYAHSPIFKEVRRRLMESLTDKPPVIPQNPQCFRDIEVRMA